MSTMIENCSPPSMRRVAMQSNERKHAKMRSARIKQRRQKIKSRKKEVDVLFYDSRVSRITPVHTQQQDGE